MTDPRYPVGPFRYDASAGEAGRREAIDAIAALPGDVRRAVAGLGEKELETPYRDGGWTVRQVVHHMVDSHVNAYMRLRLALTEDEPVIRPYDEVAWAELPDARSARIDLSLDLLVALHARWAALLKALPDTAFGRRWRHPVSGVHTVEELVQMYAWHGRHHLAHITSLRHRKGW